jgi:hypothetical protein
MYRSFVYAEVHQERDKKGVSGCGCGGGNDGLRKDKNFPVSDEGGKKSEKLRIWLAVGDKHWRRKSPSPEQNANLAKVSTNLAQITKRLMKFIISVKK